MNMVKQSDKRGLKKKSVKSPLSLEAPRSQRFRRAGRRCQEKKRLDEPNRTSAGPSTQQIEESMMHDGAPPEKNDIPVSTKQMPERSVLDALLENLEKEDTGKLFAQPLNPNEAYGGVPQKAMDFGTVRAKLEEGMYKELKEFKDDVFLMIDNAMHLYPACTINFRQTKAIHALANSIFKTLEADLRNAELKASMIEHGKKTQHESEGSHVQLDQLHIRNIVADSGLSGGIHTESNSEKTRHWAEFGNKRKGESEFLHVKLGQQYRRNSVGNGQSGGTIAESGSKNTSHCMRRGKQSKGVSKGPCVQAGQQLKRNSLSCNVPCDETATGAKRSRKVSSLETDRRQTYSRTSTVLTVYDSQKQLLPVNEDIISEDSLMRSWESLEPMAWEGLNQASNNSSVPVSSMLASSSATQLLPDYCVDGSASLGFPAPGNAPCNSSVAGVGDPIFSFTALLNGDPKAIQWSEMLLGLYN